VSTSYVYGPSTYDGRPVDQTVVEYVERESCAREARDPTANRHAEEVARPLATIGRITHKIAKNSTARAVAAAAMVRLVTRSKTSHTTPDVVAASENNPARAAWLAAPTIQRRSPWRKSTR